MQAFKKILVPIDFSVSSRAALEAGLSIAKSFGGTVDVIHTWNAPSYLPAFTALKVEKNEPTETVQSIARNEASQAMHKFLESIDTQGVEVRPRVELGTTARVVVRASPYYDLIVMGTHGRTGLDRLVMGSVAQKVVQQSYCPVLTVREDKVDAHEDAELRRHPDERVVYGVLNSQAQVWEAFRKLQDVGVHLSDISLMMSEDTHETLKDPENQEALRGAAAGTAFGGTIGGILGGLTSVSALALGGPIGLMVMGPAVALAAAGGLAGGLLGWGIPQEHAHRLQEAIEEGRSVIAVHVNDREELERIEGVLDVLGAENVHLGK